MSFSTPGRLTGLGNLSSVAGASAVARCTLAQGSQNVSISGSAGGNDGGCSECNQESTSSNVFGCFKTGLNNEWNRGWCRAGLTFGLGLGNRGGLCITKRIENQCWLFCERGNYMNAKLTQQRSHQSGILCHHTTGCGHSCCHSLKDRGDDVRMGSRRKCLQ